eukprot:TRINITY_DN7779_c0_g1_i1.p1 TRINITY_DN7779_c0_g1~~TRINITY_DN7779_c0_g1_i1.p1  ORF type:complete len:981 (-),score=281.21 TRINITY_DN7779_c0_g1_i1:127-2637(-)
MVALLSVLTTLPEECGHDKHTLAPVLRRGFAKQAIAAAPDVTQFIYISLTHSGSDANLQKLVFACFVSWLRYVQIPAYLVIQNPVVVACFDAINVEALFPTIVQLICCLVSKSKIPTTKKEKRKELKTHAYESFKGLIPIVVTGVVPLVQKLEKAIDADNTVVVHGLCRVFSKLGKGYRPLIIRGMAEDPSGRICQALLACMRYPDHDVVGVATQFWQSLSQALVNHPPEVRTRLASFFTQLVDIVLKHMWIPANWDNLTKEQQENEKYFRRYELGQTLCAACDVLTTDFVLSSIHRELVNTLSSFQQQQQYDWHPLEALLYGVCAVAACMENNSCMPLQKILETAVSLPPLSPQLLHTSVRAVGRFAEWLSYNPAALPQLLNFVVKNLSNPEGVSPAAEAFSSLCKFCTAFMVQHLDPLFLLYQSSHVMSLTQKDHEEILAGMSNVVAAIPQEDQRAKALELLCVPLLQKLQLQNAALASPAATGLSSPQAREIDEDAVINLVESVSCIFRTGKNSKMNFCYAVLEKVWTVLGPMLEAYARSDSVERALCHVCHDAVDACGTCVRPLLPSMLTRLCAAFAASLCSAALDTLTTCVKTFREASDAAPMLVSMAGDVTTVVLRALRNADDCQEHADVVKNYMWLCTELVNGLPAVMLGDSKPLLYSMLCWSLLALPVQDSGAAKALLRFHEQVFISAKKQNPAPVATDGDGTFGADLEAVLRMQVLGVALFRGWLLSMCRWQPFSSISFFGDAIAAAMEVRPALTLECAKVAAASVDFGPPVGGSGRGAAADSTLRRQALDALVAGLARPQPISAEEVLHLLVSVHIAVNAPVAGML